MSKYVYALIAAAVLTGLGGFLIKRYENAARQDGLAKGRLECTQNQINATADALAEREGINNDEREIDDFDAALFKLGIMRDYEDR